MDWVRTCENIVAVKIPYTSKYPGNLLKRWNVLHYTTLLLLEKLSLTTNTSTNTNRQLFEYLEEQNVSQKKKKKFQGMILPERYSIKPT